MTLINALSISGLISSEKQEPEAGSQEAESRKNRG
jgi:hypothetical protein